VFAHAGKTDPPSSWVTAGGFQHRRPEEALALLGKLPRAVVRPPLVKITDAEIARIRDALIETELLGTRTALGRNAA
jgi:4-hydroxy-tetrahydrodipicolinate synthase